MSPGGQMRRRVLLSNTKQKQLDAYLRAGLTEPFAKAILDGIDPKEVLELWEQDFCSRGRIDTKICVKCNNVESFSIVR